VHIIDRFGYVAGAKTAAFVTVYAQIPFLGAFMFAFFIVVRN